MTARYKDLDLYRTSVHQRAKIAEEATDAVRYVFKFAGVTLETSELSRVTNLLMKLLTERMEHTDEPK
jgi:hypothetical protein